MKGDITRSTFDSSKHYNSVRMQQGRVQTDADWNEQADIEAYLHETTTADIIGPTGTPFEGDGFMLIIDDAKLSISPGHFYVDGILCENDKLTAISEQDDLLATEVLAGGEGKPDFTKTYLAFLQVWKYHLTALENPRIREVALGGPDTTTRLKTLWQVRLLELDPAAVAAASDDGVLCLEDLKPWKQLRSLPTGKLEAKIPPDAAANEETPCLVPPSAGYRRLENQLYRVEVHQGAANRVGTTFKWSRDNGSILAKWESQDSSNPDIITVSTTGRDKVLNFAPGHLIEITDDKREKNRLPGILVTIEKVDGVVLTINPAGETVDFNDFSDTRKIRRWEGRIDALATNDPQELEDGVQIILSGGSYRTGDYWLIPARTLVGIEWPAGPSAPHGIDDHYAPLAVITALSKAGIADHRARFQSLARSLQLSYLGGDGQQAMPIKDGTLNPGVLPELLRVGVSSGGHPVNDALVRFTLVSGGGSLTAVTGAEIRNDADWVDYRTGEDGIVAVRWSLGLGHPSCDLRQEVRATLLDACGKEETHLPIVFSASVNRWFYHIRDRFRRHNQFLHGWGVVCGADVTPVAGSKSVLVSAGFAVSPVGDEIHIPASAAPLEFEITESEPRFLAICAVPMAFASKLSANGDCDWARLDLGFKLTLLKELPPSHQEAVLSCKQLEEIVCHNANVPYPGEIKPNEHCVVLARVQLGEAGVEIDPTFARRRLLSESLMFQYLQCKCDEAPPVISCDLAGHYLMDDLQLEDDDNPFAPLMRDSSSLGHHGRHEAGPGGIFLGESGKVNLAVRYTKGGQSTVDASKLNLAESFTVSLWFNPSSASDAPQALCVLGERSTTPDFQQANFGVAWFGEIRRVIWVSDDGTEIETSDQFTEEEWHHLTVVCRFQGQVDKGSDYIVQLFVDGALQASDRAIVRESLDRGTLFFGAFDGGLENALEGLLDDIRIFNRALKDTEVKLLFENPDKPLVCNDDIEGLTIEFDPPSNVIVGQVKLDGLPLAGGDVASIFAEGPPANPMELKADTKTDGSFRISNDASGNSLLSGPYLLTASLRNLSTSGSIAVRRVIIDNSRPFEKFRAVTFSELSILEAADAENLEAAGIEDLTVLAVSNPVRIANTIGPPPEKAARLVAAARQQVSKLLIREVGALRVEDLDGIGPVRGESLVAAGIRHPVDVALSEPGRIAEILGIADAKSIVLGAREFVNAKL